MKENDCLYNLSIAPFDLIEYKSLELNNFYQCIHSKTSRKMALRTLSLPLVRMKL
jgi:hypothetical protein